MYSNDLVVKILNYIDEHLKKPISMQELSDKFFFNKDYIMRVFKKEIKMTIVEYINTKRIYNSLKQLRTTDFLIIKIALDNGFSSLEYYSEIFSKIMGANPRTYRKFYNLSTDISNEDFELIRNRLLSISEKLEEIERYKKNTRPSEDKKLTLFKTLY